MEQNWKARPEKLWSEERRARLEPSKIAPLMDMFPGAKVADVGCGSGFFTVELAKEMPDGEIWAVDVSDEMLCALKERLAERGVKNVTPLLCQENGIPLPDGYLDRALTAQVLHEANNKRAFLAEVSRILKEGGKIVLVDWRRAPSPSGPPLKERVAVKEAMKLLTDVGFWEIGHHSIYPYSYFLTSHKR